MHLTNLNDGVTCHRQLHGYNKDRWEGVTIGVEGSSVSKIRQVWIRRFGWDIPKFEETRKVGDEFITKAALFIVDLIPPEIFADALEDQFPDLAEVANFIRDWTKSGQ